MPWAQGTDEELVLWDGLAALGGAGSARPLSLVYSGQRAGCAFAHLLCLVFKPRRPPTWHGGCVSIGSRCPPRRPVLVPVGELFSPCLKNCTLLPCSGALPGCCMVGVGRRSLLSWGELSRRQRLHGASAPARTVCLPTLPSWDGAGVRPGAQREMLLPCRVTAAVACVGAGVWPAVCGRIYSWLLALASSSPSPCQHQCLLDIYCHLFSGLCFLVWCSLG